MRKFTRYVGRSVPLLLGVALLGVVGAANVNPPMPLFEDKPEVAKGTISGVVTMDGNPAAGVTVKITAPRTSGGSEGTFESNDPFDNQPIPMVPSKARDRTVASTRTNTEGRFTVDVPAGQYKVVAIKLGAKGETPIEVVAGKNHELTVQLKKIERGGSGGGKGGTGGAK